MEEYVVAAVADAEERNRHERIRLRGLRDASNPFDQTEVKFRKLFRLPRSSARYLCDTLKDHPFLNETGYIPNYFKILAALHFYTDGSYQTPVGEDSLLSLSQPSVSRALEETTNAIVETLSPEYIKFPVTREEKEATKRNFLENFNMPDVLGAVDGTHVAIFKPANNDPLAPGVLCYNRKGFYSINCQAVVNANGRITSINPNFPGSTHDSAIWRASAVARLLERDFVEGVQDQYLLGDKGYPLLPWLMTPLTEPETEAEQNYNSAHARARNTVEMTFGRLKNKLRCLHKHRTLHYEPAKAAKIIIACCTLYNMFFDVLSDSEDSDSEEELVSEDNGPNAAEEAIHEADYLAMARAKRQSLIQYFS